MMVDLVFDAALKKRLKTATAATAAEVTTADTILIYDSETDTIKKVTYGVLVAALGVTFPPKAGPTLTGIVTIESIVKSSRTANVTALNTPVDLVGSQAMTGLVRVRDQTLGGSAVFIVDPNAGVQTIGTNQITGLSIAYNPSNGYILQASLSSGAVPRVLNWSIFGGQ